MILPEGPIYLYKNRFFYLIHLGPHIQPFVICSFIVHSIVTKSKSLFLTGENISHHLCSTFSVSDTIGSICIFKSNRPVWEGFYFPNLTNSTQLLCVKVGTRTQVSLTPCTKSNHISPKHPKALGCVYTCKGQTGMKIIR